MWFESFSFIEKLLKFRCNLVDMTMKIIVWLWAWRKKTSFDWTKIYRSKISMFSIIGINFVFKVEGSFSYKQTSNHYLSTNVLNLHSIIILNIMWINTIPTSIIESNRYSRLNTSIFFISSSNQIISRNWGMMTNLLEINRASIYISLISFS